MREAQGVPFTPVMFPHKSQSHHSARQAFSAVRPDGGVGWHKAEPNGCYKTRGITTAEHSSSMSVGSPRAEDGDFAPTSHHFVLSACRGEAPQRHQADSGQGHSQEEALRRFAFLKFCCLKARSGVEVVLIAAQTQSANKAPQNSPATMIPRHPLTLPQHPVPILALPALPSATHVAADTSRVGKRGTDGTESPSRRSPTSLASSQLKGSTQQ